MRDFIIHEPKDVNRVTTYLDDVSCETSLLVQVKKYKKARTIAQNSLMWLWYDVLAKHLDETRGELYSSDDLHEFFKQLFLPKRVINFTKKSFAVQTGTSDLNVLEMMGYLDQLDMYCADRLGLLLPKPDLYQEAKNG